MKRTYLLLITAAAFFTGCNKNDIPTDGTEPINSVPLTFTATMPEEKPQTRVALSRAEDGKSILVKWKAGDKVQFFFKKQDGAVVKGSEEPVTVVPDTDDKKATFNVTLPAGVSAPYTVYLVHGATATTDGSKIEVDVSPVGFKKLEDLVTPLVGKAEVTVGNSPSNIPLEHLGALQCLLLANYGVNAESNAGDELNEIVSLDYTGNDWFYKQGSRYDLVSQSVTTIGSDITSWQQVIVPAWQNIQLAQWVMPDGNIPPEIRLKTGAITSANSKPARRASLQKGQAYHLNASINHNHTVLQFDEPLIWAGSNIYWDEARQRLTFDETVVDASQNTDLKGGVAFMWGSLVGISLSATYATYTPDYNTGAPAASTWSSGTTGYTDIANFYGVQIDDGGQANTYLNDPERNTDGMYTQKKGDICKYLSKTGAVTGNWRMPTANELNAVGLADKKKITWTATSLSWSKFGSFESVTNTVADGKTVIQSGANYTVGTTTTRFPASGYRTTGGAISSAGEHGRSWSSSASSGTDDAFYLYFYSGYVNPATYYYRQIVFPIRCVRDN